jgi:CRP/FNR family transcriptional regulator, cyclic AMP receptor protein
MGDLLGGGWIEGLPVHVRDAVRSAMRPVVYENGDVIFRQGDGYDELFEIISGQVNITHVNFDGTEQVVTVFGVGDCFGEQSLVDQLPRANSAHARGRTHVRALRKVAFNALRNTHPEVSEALLKLISWRFRLALAMLSEQWSSSLRQRLLRRIYALAESAGTQTDHGVELAVRVSQTELANWVGFSRQRVNMALMELQRAGLIRMTQGRITIVDAAAVAAQYDGDYQMPLVDQP